MDRGRFDAKIKTRHKRLGKKETLAQERARLYSHARKRVPGNIMEKSTYRESSRGESMPGDLFPFLRP